MKTFATRMASILLVLLVWELVARSGAVPQDYFPTVPSILRAAWAMIGSGELVRAEGQTLVRAVSGLLLTIVFGMACALLAARFTIVARALAPLIEVMRSIPPAALVPLAIFLLGLTPVLFIGIVVFAGFSTVYLTTLHGLNATEPVQIHVARTLGYSRLEILFRIRLHAAWPSVFTGIRVAAGSALIASIASEMLAGKDGLGFLLFDTAFSLRTSEMFSVMLVAALNGIFFNVLVMTARRPLAGWQDQLARLGERT